jgi:hypothetical protein
VIPVDRGPRPARHTVALATVGVALVASGIVLAYWGRGQTFGGDEMAYASRLSEQSLGHALLHPPPDKYLIALPLLVFRGFLGVFGFDSETPFRLLALGLGLLCGGLFFLLARRRVGDLVALPPTMLLLFFGYGWDEVLTGERIPELMAFAAGLAMLLALRARSRRGDLASAVLLTASLASHPSGLAFAAAAAVLVLFRPSPERWRSAWVFLVPVAMYAVWWLFLREPGISPVQKNVGELASFVGQSWTAATAAVSGIAGVIDGSAYHHALGWVAGGFLFVAVVAGVAKRWRSLPPSFWAVVVALLTLWVTTALGRGDAFAMFARPADAPRYLYPSAILLLLLLVELAGAVRLPAWGAWAATGVLALGLVANLDRLHDAGVQQRLQAEQVRASFGAVQIAAEVVQPTYRAHGLFYPTAHEYLDAVRAFGSPAYSPAQLAARPPGTRAVADSTLAQAMGLRVRAKRSTSPTGPPPQVDTELQGTSKASGGCLELQPARLAAKFVPQESVLAPPPIEGSAPPPALAEVTLPPGGVSIGAERIAQVGLRVGRFADSPAVPLAMPQAGAAASLVIPEDNVALPWKLVVYSSEPVRACGLAAVPTT